jgi:hypothetical protein
METNFTHTNVLKVVVDCVSWVSSRYTTPWEQIPEDQQDNNSWWYLHGKLEDRVRYDKATAINCLDAGYSTDALNYAGYRGEEAKIRNPENLLRKEMRVNGIIPVKVKGIKEMCVGYFWTIECRPLRYNGKQYPCWEQRGLVCLKSDTEGREDALRKYTERRSWL